jgi:hypothetical protein
MDMMMRMFDAIHDSDIGLCRQHDAQRHAEDGDYASQRDKAQMAQQRLALAAEVPDNALNLAQFFPKVDVTCRLD